MNTFRAACVPAGRAVLAAAATVAAGLAGLVVTPAPAHAAAGERVYLLNRTYARVEVIDATTSSITAVIPVSLWPMRIVPSPDGTKLYSVSSESGKLDVIDLASNTVTASVLVAVGANDIRLTADGGTAFISATDGLYRVDTATNSVTGSLTLASHTAVVALPPSGTTVFVGNTDVGTITAVNASTMAVAGTANGLQVIAMTVSPDGRTVYQLGDLQFLSVLDVVSRTISANSDYGGLLRDMVLSPDGSTLFISNERSNSMTIVDAATNAASGLDVGTATRDMWLTPDGTRIAVQLVATNEIGFIDIATRTLLTDRVKLPDAPGSNGFVYL